MGRRWTTLLVLCLAWLATAGIARAHEVRPASLELVQTAATTYSVTWKRPARGRAVLGLAVAYPKDCTLTATSRRTVAGTAYDRGELACERSLSGRTVTVEGLDATLIDVLARVTLRSSEVQTVLLRGETPSFEVARTPTALEVAARYVPLGVEHILSGIDHLLFVFGLLLVLSGWRALLAAVTAFTVAHSITLALASFDVVRLSSAPVEATIALSIVFLFAEYLQQTPQRPGWTARRPWAIPFTVGLLHGLGFAGALSEVGLPQTEIPVALVSFNVGVELGQLMFVAVVLAVFALERRLRKEPLVTVRRTAAWALGSVASFWFFERAAAVFAAS